MRFQKLLWTAFAVVAIFTFTQADAQARCCGWGGCGWGGCGWGGGYAGCGYSCGGCYSGCGSTCGTCSTGCGYVSYNGCGYGGCYAAYGWPYGTVISYAAPAPVQPIVVRTQTPPQMSTVQSAAPRTQPSTPIRAASTVRRAN